MRGERERSIRDVWLIHTDINSGWATTDLSSLYVLTSFLSLFHIFRIDPLL